MNLVLPKSSLTFCGTWLRSEIVVVYDQTSVDRKCETKLLTGCTFKMLYSSSLKENVIVAMAVSLLWIFLVQCIIDRGIKGVRFIRFHNCFTVVNKEDKRKALHCSFYTT